MVRQAHEFDKLINLLMIRSDHQSPAHIAILNDLYLVPTLQRWNPSVTLRVTPL